MSMVINAGLRYGEFKGFEYVYGVPVMGSMNEIIEAIPHRIENGQRIVMYEHNEIGHVYILTDYDSDEVPTEVLDHIYNDYLKHCFEWFEFKSARDFLSYLNVSDKDKDTKVYIDTKKGKYYAKHGKSVAALVADFAQSVDTEFAGRLEANKTLTEVKLKEEVK